MQVMKESALSIASTDSSYQQLPMLQRIVFLSKKLLEYIIRYIDNPRYLILYLSRVLMSSYREKVAFMSATNFIEAAKRRSTIRFQDGEFGLLLGKRGVYFQAADPRLKEKLEAAIHDYSNASPYLLGLPPFIKIPNSKLHAQNFKYLWMPSKIMFRLFFPKDALYFNGCYFYVDGTILPFFHTFADTHDIIIVTNEANIKAVRIQQEKFFPKTSSVKYIETPAQDAFAVYEELLEKIISATTERSVVFMACGPAGKALIYDLSKQNILAHDIGHGIKFALIGASQENQIKWSEFKKYLDPNV